MKLNSGTTTSPAVWEQAASLGVDAITVNDVAAYQRWLADYNSRNKYVPCGTVALERGTVALEQGEHGTATLEPAGRLLPGTEVAVSAEPDAGYEFTGWQTSPSMEITGDGFAMPAGDLTVQPVFAAVTYRIDYDLAGGEAENPGSYTVESPDLALVAPARDGYRFTGWTGTGLETATTDVVIPAGSTGDRSYTAVWE